MTLAQDTTTETATVSLETDCGCEEDVIVLGDYSAEQRQQMAKKGSAMSDGSYPIANCQDVKDAVHLVGRSKKHSAASVKRHIIKRAKALGCSSSLPDDWVSQESQILDTFISLEDIPDDKLIVQEASAENGGVMIIRVPFCVGGSISRAPGFNKPIHFPSRITTSIVQEAKADLSEGLQPLTVYARHSHAANADRLPIGAVRDVEQEGSRAYAVVAIAPTSLGKDAQLLIKNRMMNAVSLRSRDFELEEKKVNGELMLEVQRLRIAGIDFAPDGPAQPTFGIEVLAAEADVEDVLPPSPKEESVVPDLTLETVRKEHPAIVAEIEAPFKADAAKVEKELTDAKARIVELEAQIKTFVDAETARKRDAKLADIASKFPEPDKAKAILQELCKDAKSEDEIAAAAFPVLMQALELVKKAEPPAPTKSPAEMLAEAFRPGGAGQLFEPQTPAKPKGEQVMGLEIPE